jgi:secreted trypsin-like serine protease
MNKIPAFSIMSILLAATLLTGCDRKEEASGVCSGNGIVGGKSVGSADYLATKAVLVQSRLNDTEASMCTGTLIARNIVLTAAHCLTDSKGVRVIFDVDPGCNPSFDRGTQSIDVRRSVIHGKYSESVKGKDDLAMLKLSRSAPSNYPVMPLYNNYDKLSSNNVTYIGYGRTREQGTFRQKLRSVVKNYSESVLISENRNLVTLQSNGRGICQGDSGGPVYFEVDGQLHLAGVNSVVMGRSDATVCHGASEAMYIPAHMTWIQKTLSDLSGR